MEEIYVEGEFLSAEGQFFRRPGWLHHGGLGKAEGNSFSLRQHAADTAAARELCIERSW